MLKMIINICKIIVYILIIIIDRIIIFILLLMQFINLKTS